MLIQLVFTGVAQGCVYGLVALGFVLIYKATETVSFAQGELLMIGAFAGLAITQLLGLPFWVGVIGALLACGVLGLLIERIAIRPVLGQPAFSVVMLTLGISYMLRGLVTMLPGIGTETHALQVPYQDLMWQVGPVTVDAVKLTVILSTAALCVLLFALFRFTRIGIAMQAASQNQLAAYYMGIPVKTLNGLVWAIAAMVSASAGLLLAPITFVHANMGLIGLKAFPAAVLGGFGSVPGAIVGGVLIGISESLAGFYLPEGIKDTVPYLLLLIMLAIRPNGLFSESTRKKV